MNFNNFTEPDFISKLESNNLKTKYDPFPKNTFTENPQEASVLIPLIKDNKDWKILFIKRAENDGDVHSAQVSLPGGRKEIDDKNEIETALRETEEEIGISRRKIHIIGQMKPYRTISNYNVTPVVSIIHWPTKISVSKSEVDKTFAIPLNWLSSKDNYHTKLRETTTKLKFQVIYFNQFENEILWGATAKFITDFLTILKS